MPNIGDLVPPGEDGMVRRIERIERQLKELGAQDPLSTAGVEVEPGVFRIVGNAQITGTLSLPAGIIDNDALANPIQFQDAFANDAGIGFSTGFVAQAVCTLAIPAGFTKFTFSGASVARCYNTSGVTVYLYAQTYSKVVGSADAWGATCQTTIPNVFQATVTAPHSVTHTIPGGATQVQVWTQVATSTACAADVNNFAGIEGVAYFSR